MIDLIGKFVIVETAETLYEGKLVEFGEDEVHLESDMGWIVIPMQKVTSVREKE
jgi:hypothetical protein